MKDYRNKQYWARLLRGKRGLDTKTIDAYMDAAEARTVQRMNGRANETGGVPDVGLIGSRPGVLFARHNTNPYRAQERQGKLKYGAGPGIFLILFWVTIAIVVGIRLDYVSHGMPKQVTMRHCAAGHPVAPDGFECRATEQAYGWPIVVRKVYTNATYMDGSQALPDHFSDHEGSLRGPSANMFLTLLVLATPYVVLRWRANRRLDAELAAQDGGDYRIRN